MAQVAVIGGSGFIGTRLVDRLVARGVPVRIVDKQPSAFHPALGAIADVRDVNTLRKTLVGADAIVNLAAEHKDNVVPRSLYSAVNVEGARNVCRAADVLNIRKIIFTSSVAVYGAAPGGTGEEGALRPFNEYGRTKAIAEDVYRAWYAREHGRTLVIIRPTVVFGERNRGNVYNLMRQMASRRFVMVGSGRNVKSIAYIENVAAFLEFCLELPKGTYLCNYVDKPDVEMKSLVRLVLNELGNSDRRVPRVPRWAGVLGGLAFDVVAQVIRRELPISSIRVQKFCMETRFASGATAMGFTAPVPLVAGLRKTIAFEFGSNADFAHGVSFETE